MAAGADDVTREIVAWVQESLPDLPVRVLASDDVERRPEITVQLANIAPLPGPRSDRAPFVLAIDYLISVRSDDPFAAHRAVGELLFAALRRPDFEIRQGLAITAATERQDNHVLPGVLIRAKLARDRVFDQAPLVRRPPVVEVEGVVPLEGIVLGPNDIPVPDAAVEIIALGASVLTDGQGRFRFAAAPGGAKPVKLSARKRAAQAYANALPGEIVTIRLPLEN